MDHSVGNGQLIVMDNALRNEEYEYPGTGYDDGRSLAYNMIMGYDKRDTWYSQPRNFIGEARDNMRQSGILTKVMREALQRRLGKDLIKWVIPYNFLARQFWRMKNKSYKILHKI